MHAVHPRDAWRSPCSTAISPGFLLRLPNELSCLHGNVVNIRMCKTRPSQEPYLYIVPGGGHIPPSTAVTGWRLPLCSVSLLQEQKRLHKALHNTGMAPAGAAARAVASTLALELLLLPEPSSPCSLASGDGGLPLGTSCSATQPGLALLQCCPGLAHSARDHRSFRSRGVSGSRGELCLPLLLWEQRRGWRGCGDPAPGAMVTPVSSPWLPCRGVEVWQGVGRCFAWGWIWECRTAMEQADLVL